MLFMNWLTDLIGGLGSVINGLLTWLFFLIGKWLYPFISYLYTLFEILVKGRLLDNDIMRTLSNRIGLLLGIVMFFIIIVNVIQMLVDPDKSNDKEKGAGGILLRVVIVLIMFGFSSFAFNSLYYIQKVVVDSNVIGRIFVPSDIKTNDFGDYLSYKLFLSFYTINPEADPDDAMVNTCKTNMEQMQLDIYNNKDYSLAQYCLDKRDSNAVEIIKFNAILAIGAAIFCIYFLFSYCITIGVRMIMLTFLEIISPMVFVSYLSPKKDNMFSKWLKLYFSTFVDSFIRIAIINFAIYMIYLVLGDLSDGSAFTSTVMDNQFVNGNDDTKVFIYTIMVFAILTFAKKAPDLIKDLFPSSSKLGFGVTTPKQFFDGMVGGNLVRGGLIGAAGLGIGAAIGGVGNAARGYIGAEKGWKNKLMGIGGGLVGGLTSGGLAGAKAKGIGKTFGASNKAAMAQNKRIVDWREAGGVSTFSRWGTALQQRLGLQTDYEKMELEYETAKKYIDSFSDAKSKADGEVDKFASNYRFRDASGSEYTLKQLDKMRNDDTHYTDEQRAQFDDVYNKIHGFARDHAMLNYGAVESGTVTWADDGSGNWDTISRNITESSDMSISTESSIKHNMENILSSDEGKNASGNNFERAKKANKIYDEKVNSKISNATYKSNKANYDATKQNK